MSEADRIDRYEKALSSNLARVLDLLRFAEAKNAALLAFASAWIVGLVNLLSSGKVLPMGYATAIMIALPLFVVAACITLISLLPKLKARSFTGEPIGGGRNLLFFGDVANLSIVELKAAIREDHFPGEDSAPSATYLDNLEVQIGINAKIAKRKYRLLMRQASSPSLRSHCLWCRQWRSSFVRLFAELVRNDHDAGASR